MRDFTKTECEAEEAIELVWTQGPYMTHTKIRGVTVTYWEGKGPLMFQGPKEGAHQLIERFPGRRTMKNGRPPFLANRPTNDTNDANDMLTRETGSPEMFQRKINNLVAFIVSWEPEHGRENEANQGKKGNSRTPQAKLSHDTHEEM